MVDLKILSQRSAGKWVKTRNTRQYEASVSVVIRTTHLPNTDERRYCLSRLARHGGVAPHIRNCSLDASIGWPMGGHSVHSG